ncbi:transporter [Fibrobacter sp. UWB10]|uniref:transporter n=1 Tax=Fibrobacter sp. UWB10 TaxID=1896201 RepID=UPI0024033C5E|nr:transporter [Fibrobacter sp. UWB10]SMP56810.1 Putative MetA-pathway of phenol degradation [Fibrobacter sp. UWB10]
MLKKIALVAAVAASASFATYNFFPVGDANKGEVEISDNYTWHDHWSANRINLAAKYNVIQNLEISLQNIGYQIWNEDDRCDDTKSCPDNDGIYAMTIGARYQFLPILIGALDIRLPLTSEDVTGDYDPFGLYAAIQFTKEFIPNLWFGSELGFDWMFEDEKVEEGVTMTIQAELDYTIAAIGLTPWIGIEFDKQLTEDKIDGNDAGGDENQLTFWVGAQYDINQMFAVKVNFAISNGDLYGDSNTLKGAFLIRF